MDNIFLLLRTKIEQLNFLYQLNEKTKITSVKHERKIKLIYHNKEYLNRCLSFSTTKDQQCMNSRVLGHKYCYKHVPIPESELLSTESSDEPTPDISQKEPLIQLYDDEYDFIFQTISSVIFYPYNSFVKSQTQNKVDFKKFEIVSFDEYKKYVSYHLQDNLTTLALALCKDYPKRKDDISKFCQDSYNFNPLKQKVVQDLTKLPLNEKKCFARISTGRQCINNRWNDDGTLLEYCNLHRKSIPHGDFRHPIDPEKSKAKKKEEIKSISIPKELKVVRCSFDSILKKPYFEINEQKLCIDNGRILLLT